MDYRLQRSVSTISRTLVNDVTTAVTVAYGASFFVNSGCPIGIKGSSTP